MKSLLTLLLIVSSLALSAQKNALTVKISNIIEQRGQIIVTLYNQATGFAKSGNEMRKVVSNTIRGKQTEVQIDNLEPGDYSVIILHDANVDGECNFNFFGIPIEGYGFSNNIVPILKVPSFDQTKFSFPQKQEITIDLIQ